MSTSEINAIIKSLSDAIKADKNTSVDALLQQLRQSIIYEVATTNAASDNNGLATDQELTTAISSLTTSINNLQDAITALTNRVSNLESSAIIATTAE